MVGTANIITIARILLIPFWLLTIATYPDIALALFVLMTLSDGIDGWVARKYNQTTELGSILDPIADKACTHVGILYYIFCYPKWWIVIAELILLCRDIQLSIVRYQKWTQQSCAGQFKVIKLSKVKSLLMFLAVAMLTWTISHNQASIHMMAQILFMLSTALAISTYVQYISNKHQ